MLGSPRAAAIPIRSGHGTIGLGSDRNSARVSSMPPPVAQPNSEPLLPGSELEDQQPRTTERAPRTKPLLLVDGNCQAQHAAAMLRAANVGEPIYMGRDCGVRPAHAGKASRIVAPREVERVIARARAQGRRIIQISQLTPLGHSKGPGPLSGADRRILFPELRMWSLSRSKFLASFKADFDLERILDLDFASLETVERKIGFPISVSAFFRENVTRRPLFHMVAHPAGALYALLLRGIAIQLCDEIDREAIDAVAEIVSTREGHNYMTHHPLSAEDRKTLGFDWGAGYELYGTMIALRDAKDWDGLRDLDGRLSALFAEDSQFWRSRAEMGRALGDHDMAVEGFEQLLNRCPGSPGVWAAYAQLLLAQAEAGRLDQLLSDAEAFFEGGFAFATLVVRVALWQRDIAGAEAQARACYESAPDELQAAHALLRVLIHKRDASGLRTLVADLRARPEIAHGELNAFLASQAQLSWIEKVLGGIPQDRSTPHFELPAEF